jgi:hypothetical protein
MSVQNRGHSDVVAEVEANTRAFRSVSYGPDVGSFGRYRVTTASAALTAIAALTSSAGHLWAFRNADSSRIALIERLRINFQLTVLPSAAQEVGFAVHQTTAHTAQPTGGADVSMATPQVKMRTSHGIPASAIHFANSTGALTAGTYTQKTLPIIRDSLWAIVAGATIPIPKLTMDLDLRASPIVVAPDEGLLIGNSILMANSVAGRLMVECEWREVSSYPQ